MFVLVTRPLNDAARTAEKLAQMGYTPVISPVLNIVPTGAFWPQGVVDAAIATSAHAFQSLQFTSEWPTPETRRLVPLFLVGARTAEAARARGFNGPMRVAADAKALCAEITQGLRAPARLLYLAGRDRKSDLESCCADAGLAVKVVEVYAAEAATSLSQAAIGLAAVGAIDAVLHYSQRSAEVFLELAAAAALDPAPLPHVAISEDAAAPLRAAALPQVIVAAEPNEEAVLALFRQDNIAAS
jgi:uroporphyrinogen-III synthase